MEYSFNMNKILSQFFLRIKTQDIKNMKMRVNIHNIYINLLNDTSRNFLQEKRSGFLIIILSKLNSFFYKPLSK